MRRALFVLALAASGLVLLLWAAGAGWRGPLRAEKQRIFQGSEFAAVFGRAAPADGRLRVEAEAEDHSSLQSLPLRDVDAAAFTALRYRFAGFPRTLELSLVFRTAEAPDDVQTVSLPWPGDGEETFDLSRIRAWRGTILELGFAEFATGQVVPPELGFRPFELVGAALWSPSWQGSLAALSTDWFGAWPWSQRSVHALGRDSDAPGARSAVLVAALAVAMACFWTGALFGFGRRRLLLAGLAAAALAWLALDLRWQASLLGRLAATRTLYAGLPWPERARIVGDSDLLRAADEVRAMLEGEPPQTRVLVQAAGSYQWLRLVWHLLPLNVDGFPLALRFGGALPENCVLVFFEDDGWRRDPNLRKLLAFSERIAAPRALMTNGFDESRLVVFRYHHGHAR